MLAMSTYICNTCTVFCFGGFWGGGVWGFFYIKEWYINILLCILYIPSSLLNCSVDNEVSISPPSDVRYTCFIFCMYFYNVTNDKISNSAISAYSEMFHYILHSVYVINILKMFRYLIDRYPCIYWRSKYMYGKITDGSSLHS